ncbi:MAG: phosphate transport system regulatory protein PhoU, partial [Verrucomicrobiae bacterium]|nr:phosphate transport system regulatory protein PhoU [Verrucomicrobiae bacterium]
LLREALDSFSKRDSQQARALILRDREIDDLNRRIHQQLVEHMSAASSAIVRCLHLMVIAKSLERIGDHAKNIAEEVVYLREALDIRHESQKNPSR